jgi:hypothetical protein
MWHMRTRDMLVLEGNSAVNHGIKLEVGVNYTEDFMHNLGGSKTLNKERRYFALCRVSSGLFQ